MKQYLLTIYQPDGDPPPPAELDAIMRDVAAFEDELRSAGAWVFSGGLHDSATATVVRPDGQDFLVTDGPYLEGKEHVGGVLVIRAEDLDAALAWTRKAVAAVPLPIEVRPFR